MVSKKEEQHSQYLLTICSSFLTLHAPNAFKDIRLVTVWTNREG